MLYTDPSTEYVKSKAKELGEYIVSHSADKYKLNNLRALVIKEIDMVLSRAPIYLSNTNF